MFTASIELTQQIKSINRNLKKHLDQNTLLKELGKVIEQELENKSQYIKIKN